MIFGFLAGIVLFSVASLFFTPEKDSERSETSASFQVYLGSINGDTADVFFFDRFLILLGEEDDKAYLILSLIVTPSNGKVYKEVKTKMTLCRSVILDVLTNSVKRTHVIEGEKLRQEILTALNAILDSGSIEHVDFSEFIIV